MNKKNKKTVSEQPVAKQPEQPYDNLQEELHHLRYYGRNSPGVVIAIEKLKTEIDNKLLTAAQRNKELEHLTKARQVLVAQLNEPYTAMQARIRTAFQEQVIDPLTEEFGPSISRSMVELMRERDIDMSLEAQEQALGELAHFVRGVVRDVLAQVEKNQQELRKI